MQVNYIVIFIENIVENTKVADDVQASFSKPIRPAYPKKKQYIFNKVHVYLNGM